MSSRAETAPAPRDVRIWVGVFAPVAAFILDEMVSFLLTPWVCHTGRRGILYLVGLAALLVSIGGGLVARGVWKETAEPPSGGDDRVIARRRFMAIGGVLLSILFSLAIVAEAIPGLIHRPCD